MEGVKETRGAANPKREPNKHEHWGKQQRPKGRRNGLVARILGLRLVGTSRGELPVEARDLVLREEASKLGR
eukprot:1475432-Pyramimonas_sp.AAC.1